MPDLVCVECRRVIRDREAYFRCSDDCGYIVCEPCFWLVSWENSLVKPEKRAFLPLPASCKRLLSSIMSYLPSSSYRSLIGGLKRLTPPKL